MDVKQLSLPSNLSFNPALPAAFVLFSLEFSVGFAMKIPMKKNAAANGLELIERLQGLTATDMTHSYNTGAFIIKTDIYEKPGNTQNNTKSKELL